MSQTDPRQHRVDYLEFAARDLDRIKAFYGQAFGWTFEDHGPDYCAFKDGRLDGGFYRADLPAASAAQGGPLVVLYSAGLESSLGKVESAGGRILKAIFAFPGGRRFHFADPSGNELAVWSDR
jgi:predicted enzyme related to lactoylglutathione lyase